MNPREGECDLCQNGGPDDESGETLTIYPIEMPHLVAYRTWLCAGCIRAVCDHGEVDDDEMPEKDKARL